MNIQESGEMYLETILKLSEELISVRSIDVAEELGFSKPSVSRAMKLLKNDGLIDIDPHGAIMLTEIGRKKAQSVYDKHIILTDYLFKLGVSKDVAEQDACRIEHYISEETFEAFKKGLSRLR